MALTPNLSIPLSLKPMEAEPVEELPVGRQWLYEPKYDGFRCLAFRDVDTVEVRWASRSPRRLGELLALGLHARPVGADRWRVGSTVLQLVGDPRAEHAGGRGCGFRYLTVQVRDVVAEHIRLCRLGWGEAAAPIRLGDVAAIIFVRDPDGTLLEVSQRASLTGPLPDR